MSLVGSQITPELRMGHVNQAIVHCFDQGLATSWHRLAEVWRGSGLRDGRSVSGGDSAELWACSLLPLPSLL